MNKRAFTLAEVLVTLSILGVVAAVTIPSVVRSFEKVANMTKLKKYYSYITNSIRETKALNNCQTFGCVLEKNNLWNNQNTYAMIEKRINLLFPFLTLDTNEKCIPEELYSLDGSYESFKYSTLYRSNTDKKRVGFTVDGGKTITPTFCTKDGVGIAFTGLSDSPAFKCKSKTKNTEQCLTALIFLSGGKKKRAVLGRDAFLMHFDAYGEHPEIVEHKVCNGKNPIHTPNQYYGGSDSDGISCLYRVMREGWKINY